MLKFILKIKLAVKARMKIQHQLLYSLQKRGFEVCRRIAERLGIRTKIVRTSFIYLTFVTLGFGFALYLFLAFWLKIKDLVYTKRTSVFDL
jgi:phage shock protein PspC (stress-responsive transcriptional regulator)